MTKKKKTQKNGGFLNFSQESLMDKPIFVNDYTPPPLGAKGFRKNCPIGLTGSRNRVFGIPGIQKSKFFGILRDFFKQIRNIIGFYGQLGFIQLFTAILINNFCFIVQKLVLPLFQNKD